MEFDCLEQDQDHLLARLISRGRGIHLLADFVAAPPNIQDLKSSHMLGHGGFLSRGSLHAVLLGLVQITPLDFPVSFPPPHRGLSFPRGVHIDIAGRGAGNFGLLFLFLLIERDSQPFVFDVFLRAVSKRRKLTVSPPQSVWPFYSRESVAIPRCPCPSCPWRIPHLMALIVNTTENVKKG